MKNYLDEIYTVSEFKRGNPALAEQAERAMQYLKGYCPDDAVFVVIEVADEFSPFVLGNHIAPFDKDRIYPLQGLISQYAFKRY